MEEKRPLVIEQRGDLRFYSFESLCCEVENHFFGQLLVPLTATSLGRSGGLLLSLVWSTR